MFHSGWAVILGDRGDGGAQTLAASDAAGEAVLQVLDVNQL